MQRLLRSFASDESGVTAVEYLLFVMLIAVVIIFAVSIVGHHLRADFNGVAQHLRSRRRGG